MQVNLIQYGTVPFSRRGRIFMLNASSSTVTAKFRGLQDEWSEEHQLVTGDRVEFGTDFQTVELSSIDNQVIDFDIGYGRLSRTESVSIKGASSGKTKMAKLTVGRNILVPANRNRTSLLIKPSLPINVCVGNNDEEQAFPVGVGESLVLRNGGDVIVYNKNEGVVVHYIEEVV